MKDILKYIVESVVDNKEDVVVEESEEDSVLQLKIKVASDDIGKVIGKNGKVIRAIRSVMKIPAIKQNKKVFVSILDSNT